MYNFVINYFLPPARTATAPGSAAPSARPTRASARPCCKGPAPPVISSNIISNSILFTILYYNILLALYY